MEGAGVFLGAIFGLLFFLFPGTLVDELADSDRNLVSKGR